MNTTFSTRKRWVSRREWLCYNNPSYAVKLHLGHRTGGVYDRESVARGKGVHEKVYSAHMGANMSWVADDE